jgi:hypothetical protein
MKSKQSNAFSLLGIVEFIAVVAVSIIFGAVAFYRVLGLLGVLHALVMAWSQNIPVGIEGREPTYYLRGSSAVIAGLLIAAASGALAWFAPEAVCMFSEGRQCP